MRPAIIVGRYKIWGSEAQLELSAKSLESAGTFYANQARLILALRPAASRPCLTCRSTGRPLSGIQPARGRRLAWFVRAQ